MKVEDIQKYLPKYLSEESQEELFLEIRKFISKSNSNNLFTTFLSDQKTLFQGDGLNGLKFYSFERQEVKDAPGVVLSNTCDISLENKRFIPNSITYAPLISLEKYQKLLEGNGISSARIEGHLKSIRNQEYTSIFYLPPIDGKIQESIIFLDRISNITNTKELATYLLENRLFTLSNFGFYLFLLKISIHFTRIREGVDRKSA